MLTPTTLKVATSGAGWERVVAEVVAPDLAGSGVELEFVTGTDYDHLPKLAARHRTEVPFDVVEFTDVTSAAMICGGHVQKMRLERMVSATELPRDRFDAYRLPAWTVQCGILCDHKAFERLGLALPERFSDLLDPRLAGKLSLVDISDPSATPFLVAAATDAGGSETNLCPGLELLRRLSATNSFWKKSTEILEQFRAGAIVGAISHAGMALRARRQGLALAFVHPKVADRRGILLQGYYGVVNGTRHPDAAERFVDSFASARGQEQMTRKTGNIPANPLALRALSGKRELMDLWIASPAGQRNLFAVDYSKLDQCALNDGWARAVKH